MEETTLKNHMRWVHTKLKGPLMEIPQFVEVANSDRIFSLLIWVEALAIYRMVKEFERELQDNNDKMRTEKYSLNLPMKGKKQNMISIGYWEGG